MKSARNSFPYMLLITIILSPIIVSNVAGNEIRLEEIVNKALFASSSDYEGTKIIVIWYNHRTKASEVKVSYKKPQQYRLEYLAPKKTSGRLVIDNGLFRWQYEPAMHQVIKTSSASAYKHLLARREEMSLLEKNYELTLVGKDKVAGHDTQIVSFIPKNKHNPKRTLWINTNHNIILQMKQYDSDGSPVLFSHYSSIHFKNNLPEQLFHIRLPHRVMVITPPPLKEAFSLAELADKCNFEVLLPSYLPAGYTLSGIGFSSNKERTFVHLRYTDGLNAISLFEERVTSNHEKDPKTETRGMKKDFATHQEKPTVLSWQSSDNLNLTLIGGIARTELLKTANSLSPQVTKDMDNNHRMSKQDEKRRSVF